MTRDNIAANVAQNLLDSGMTFFTQSTVNSAIQDAYDEVTFVCQQLEASVQISQESGLVYYDFGTLIPDYLAITQIYNDVTKRWLEPTSTRRLDAMRRNWETWEGEPRYFFIHSYNIVGIVPHKTTATGTFKVFYRSRADILSSSIVPRIHTDSMKLLELFSTGDLLSQNQEFAKSRLHKSRYLEGLLKYRNAQKELARPDRGVTLR